MEQANKSSQPTTKIATLEAAIKRIIETKRYFSRSIQKVERIAATLTEQYPNTSILVAELYLEWGKHLSEKALDSTGKKVVQLYQQAFEKYETASTQHPQYAAAFYHWGVALNTLAYSPHRHYYSSRFRILRQAADKLSQAQAIDPTRAEIYGDLGKSWLNLFKYDDACTNFEKAVALRPDYFEALHHWAKAEAKQANRQEDAQKADEGFRKAYTLLEKASRLQPEDATPFYQWAWALTKQAEQKEGTEADELYAKAYIKYQRTTTLDPNHVDAFYQWAATLVEQAKTKKGQAKADLYQQACMQYEEAYRQAPKRFETVYNWGKTLRDLAEIQEGAVADKLYHEAVEKLNLARNLSARSSVFNSLGITYTNWGEMKGGKEGKALYNRGISAYRMGLRRNPKHTNMLFNMGLALRDDAEYYRGKKAQARYLQSIEHFKRYIEEIPDDHIAFNNWGYCLGNIGKLRRGEEAIEWYKKAIEKFKLGVELGDDAYNLACYLAQLPDKENAFYYLEDVLKKGAIDVQSVKEDDDWAAFLEDNAFIKLLQKYE